MHDDLHQDPEQPAEQTGSDDLVGDLAKVAIAGTTASLREDITSTIRTHGDEYLAVAVKKIKDAGNQVVDWSRRNPKKAAITPRLCSRGPSCGWPDPTSATRNG